MIRDVATGKTGDIGSVRYVEKGNTVNISTGYIVEGGKTVLVFSDIKPICLYNEGTTADIMGEWVTITDFDSLTNDYGIEITYVKYDGDYIEIHKDAGNSGNGGMFRSGNKIDLSAYSTLYIELEGESTILDEGINARFVSLYCDLGENFNMSWTVAEYDQIDKKRYTASTNISNLFTSQGYLFFSFNMIVKQAATIKIHKIWVE